MIEHSVALCMIVRDEINCIEACLSSVAGFVQEVWVIDTGSTDGTAELARQLGAQVIHYPWSNDFSAARNAGIEKATTEWILVMDADEVLASEDIPTISAMLASTNAAAVAGFFLHIHSFLGDQAGLSKDISYNVRLFRNNPRYRYEGAVHEQILSVIQRVNPEGEIAELPAKVLHYGYLNEVYIGKQKPLRNLEIIRHSLQSNPDDYHMQYHAAVCLYNMGELDEALGYLNQVLEKAPRDLNYVARSLKIMVIILRHVGKYSDALAALNKYQQLWPQYTDLQHLRAQLYINQGDLSRALDAALECIKQGPAPSPYDSHEGIGTHATAKLVGDISLQLGDKALAEKAYEMVPLDNRVHLQCSAGWLSLISARLGENSATMELLRRMPRPYDYELLAEICLSAGMAKAALRFSSAARGWSSAKQQLLHGRILHQSGQLREALECLRQISRDKTVWGEACLWQAYCALGLSSSAYLVDMSTTWGAVHPENQRLLNLLSYLAGGEKKVEPALDLLLPVLSAVAPHSPLAVLERAIGIVINTPRSLLSIQLASTLYTSYHNAELAWRAYDHRPAGASDPWLEARLHEALGRPLLALRSSLGVLASGTATVPADYLKATKNCLALCRGMSTIEG